MFLRRVYLAVVLILCLLIFQSTTEKELFMQTEHWPPYVIFQPDGRVEGIDIDILKEVVRRLKVDIRVVEVAWMRALIDMEKGDADLLSNVLRRPEREEYMYYLEPPYVEYTTKCFYMKKGSGVVIDKYSDIYRYKIGTTRGSAYFPRFDDDKRVNKVDVATTEQQIKMLEVGNIEALIGTEAVIDYFLSSDNRFDQNLFEKSGYNFRQRNPLYFTISRKSPFMKRVSEIERVLRELKEEGFIEEVIKRYR